MGNLIAKEALKESACFVGKHLSEKLCEPILDTLQQILRTIATRPAQCEETCNLLFSKNLTEFQGYFDNLATEIARKDIEIAICLTIMVFMLVFLMAIQMANFVRIYFKKKRRQARFALREHL